MWICKLLLIFLVVLNLSSCKNVIDYDEVKLKSKAHNASIPILLVQKISEEFKNNNPDIKLTAKQVYDKFGFYSKEVWPLTVQIMTKKQSNPKLYNITDESARLDLNSYLSANKDVEDFYLTINLKTQKFNKLYVYFIPSSKNENDKCEKFYDISNYYQKKLSDEVILSRDDDHYIKNQLGTYVFFSPLNKDKFQLNILQLTDSSIRDRLCSQF